MQNFRHSWTFTYRMIELQRVAFAKFQGTTARLTMSTRRWPIAALFRSSLAQEKSFRGGSFEWNLESYQTHYHDLKYVEVSTNKDRVLAARVPDPMPPGIRDPET
jgi:hypothetical protein